MNIQRGNTEWGKAQFEWFSHPVNTFTFLGWHNSVCITASMPVAKFIIAPPLELSLYDAIQNGDNTTPYTFNLSLTGTWSNDVAVYYNDSYNYTNYFTNPLSCNSPQCQQTNDYYYNPLGQNFVNFPSAGSGSNPSGSFVANFYVTSTQSDIISNGYSYIWACFGIDLDPNYGAPFQYYTVGTPYTGNLYITADQLAGIKTIFNDKNINVYPNPFSDQVTIENKSKAIINQVSVTDMLGREVLKATPNNASSFTINTGTFNKGVYFVKVSNNSDSFTVKLVKE